MHRTLLACMFVVSCGANLHPIRDHPARAFVEHLEPGVLLVALGAERLSQELRDVQLELITKAARNGPVLVLASSSRQQAMLEQTCMEHEDLCKHIRDGNVKIAVEPHRGPWIRDYGPFIQLRSSRNVLVVDAKYDSARIRHAFEYRLESLNWARRDLLETIGYRNSNAHNGNMTNNQLGSASDFLLQHGAELAQLYKDEASSRFYAMDDDAPFYIAEAAIGYDRFEVVHSSIHLSGGNLFHLEDGTCLTTTDLIADNNGDRLSVERELMALYHCKRVAFLEALPGEDIIKHIDMFLMPAGSKTILLASYEPESLMFAERFIGLDNELRALVTESAIAMSRNKKRLQQLGYEVVDVPSLFPRRTETGMKYFPTLLNGVVQVGRDRRRHLLLPQYLADSTGEAMVMSYTLMVFRMAFGSSVDIQTIESTKAAKLQGALHCLTNTVPFSVSLFAHDDGIGRKMRERISRYSTYSSN